MYIYSNREGVSMRHPNDRLINVANCMNSTCISIMLQDYYVAKAETNAINYNIVILSKPFDVKWTY